MKKRFFLILIVLLTLGLGCLCLSSRITPVSPSPTRQAMPIQLASPTRRAMPTALASPTRLKIPTPSAVETPVNKPIELAKVGPWLLVETIHGLWAANLDGSGLTQLTDSDYWDYRLPTALQPHGDLVAFISPAGSGLHNMALNLLSLSKRTITKVTNLTSTETEAYANLQPGEAGLEALLAVRERHNLAWSADGRWLAFVGVMDGPTAEVYTYDTALREIRRISQDDAQNYSPSWSPDGKTLLYFGTDSFSSGSVLTTSGVWAAKGEELTPKLLFSPEGKIGAEHLAGWLDDTTAVLDSVLPASGPEQLRLYDVVSNETVMLDEGWMLAAEVDSFREALIYTDGSSLFLLRSPEKTPVQVSQQEVEWISPVNPGEYFFKVYFTDGSLATYGTSEHDHAVSPVTVRMGSGGQDVSIWGWIWLWTSTAQARPGAWVSGEGMEVGRIFDDPASFPMWDQNSNLFFFGVEGVNAFRLYRATFEALYKDVTEVGFIEAAVRSVGWLGNP